MTDKDQSFKPLNMMQRLCKIKEKLKLKFNMVDTTSLDPRIVDRETRQDMKENIEMSHK